MQYSNPTLPSNLYTEGAERVDTRQFGQMLLQQQRQKQMQHAKQESDLQKQYSAETGKLLGVDKPGALERYNAWKQTAIKLNSDKELQKDPTAFAQAQSDLGKRRADYEEWVGNGAQRHDFIQYQQKVKPEDRDDNHGTRLSSYMKTPMDKLGDYNEDGKKVDLNNYDSYIHTDPDFDFAKFKKGILGDKMTSEGAPVPIDKNGIQSNVPIWEHFGNTPLQVATNAMQSAATDHKTNKVLTRLGAKLHDEDFANMDAKYNAIPKEEWAKRGLSGPQEIPLSKDASLVEKTARYMGQQAAVENPAILKETKQRTDEKKKMDYQFANSKELLAKRIEGAKSLAADKKKVNAGEAKSTLNGIMDDLVTEAKKNPVSIGTVVADKKGNVISQTQNEKTFDIPLTPDIAKAAAIPGKSEADALRLVEKGGQQYIKRIVYKAKLSPDGKTIIGHEVGANNKPIIDESQSGALIPIKQFRNQIGNQLFAGKTLQGELGQDMDAQDVLNEDDSQPDMPSLPTIPKKADHSAKADELLKKYLPK